MAAAPRLTVRSFAEMIPLPAYQQLRILHDQKYPRSEPQTFKMPFYQPALKGIRDYYRNGNSPVELAAARVVAKAARLDARRVHNLRVIDQFEVGKQARRKLNPIPGRDCQIVVSGVELRLRFDLSARDATGEHHILYNFRNAPMDDETARTTLELAAWLLQQTGSPIRPRELEYVDIITGDARTISKIRASTLKKVSDNAKLIRTLWPAI